MATQLAHHAQHRQLRAARLELGDDSRDEHNPQPFAGGRRSRVNELGPRRPQPPRLAYVSELCVDARQQRGPPAAPDPEDPISVPILPRPQLEDALAAGAPTPDTTRVLPAPATEATRARAPPASRSHTSAGLLRAVALAQLNQGELTGAGKRPGRG